MSRPIGTVATPGLCAGWALRLASPTAFSIVDTSFLNALVGSKFIFGCSATRGEIARREGVSVGERLLGQESWEWRK